MNKFSLWLSFLILTYTSIVLSLRTWHDWSYCNLITNITQVLANIFWTTMAVLAARLIVKEK